MMNAALKLLQTYRRTGWVGISRKGILYLLRRVARSTDGWVKGLEQATLIYDYDLSAEDKALLGRNEIFRDRHRSERCFVIGNGPSLKSQDLSPLVNEFTFVMSGFWKHPVVEQWQPSYYFFADSLFFDGSEPMREFFTALGSRIHSTTFFVPLYSREVIQRMSLLPLDQTYFVAFRERLGLSGRPDFTRIVPVVMSASQFAIMAAMYMGCSPIYLLGLDHDWLYEGATIDNHPEVQPNLDRWSYKFLMECQLELWYGYESLLKVAEAEGICILNATNGGFLDVFERMDYESVVQGTH
jgi:hypothetical protein